MANQKAEGRTETGGKAPAAGGLSPLEGKLGQIKPTYVEVDHGLRQLIKYQVGGYVVYVRPSSLTILEHGFRWKLEVSGPEQEIADFYYVEEPEPTLFDVLDYWAGMAWFLEHMAYEMADILKEGEAKA